MKGILLYLTMLITIYFLADTTIIAEQIIKYMFIFSPFVSIVLTLPLRRSIRFTVELPASTLDKHNKAFIKFCIENKSFLPAPFIDVKFINSFRLATSMKPVQRFSLGPYESKIIFYDYTATLRGQDIVGLHSVTLRDYMGLLSFNLLKNFKTEGISSVITIIPGLQDIDDSSRIFLNRKLTPSYDSTELPKTNELSNFKEPGYELREFIYGDSLKKINWKISAKTDVLMVRNDDPIITKSKSIILDPFNPNLGSFYYFTYYQLCLEEKLLETVLSIINVCILNEINIKLCLYEKNKWVVEPFSKESFIYGLQYKMATYSFCNISKLGNKGRLPIDQLGGFQNEYSAFDSHDVIIVTFSPDKSLLQMAVELATRDFYIHVIAIKQNSYYNADIFTQEYLSTLEQQNIKLWFISLEEDLLTSLY